MPVFAKCGLNNVLSGPNVALVPPKLTVPNKPHQAKNKTKTGDSNPTTCSKNVVGNPTVFEEALGALFTSECLVIAEYLETIIPIVYGVYLFVMVHLPLARYHGELNGITDFGGKQGMVFLYGLLELASFIMFAMVLSRNCRLNAFYHLAFVLETQSAVIQTKLVVWMIAFPTSASTTRLSSRGCTIHQNENHVL